MSVPSFETERLRLRGHAREDFEACAAMWADPEVTKFIGGVPSTSQRTWMRLTAYRGHWSLMSFGYWAVEELSSGIFIGEVGFADFKRGLSPALDHIPELGWAFASHAHGKGYATEAARAAIAWGDRELPAPRTICLIDDANVQSIRVATKCGYTPYGRTESNGAELGIYAREAMRPGRV